MNSFHSRIPLILFILVRTGIEAIGLLESALQERVMVRNVTVKDTMRPGNECRRNQSRSNGILGILLRERNSEVMVLMELGRRRWMHRKKGERSKYAKPRMATVAFRTAIFIPVPSSPFFRLRHKSLSLTHV